MSKYAYITTTARCHPVAGVEGGYEPPREPDGDGWELVGVSANEQTRFYDWRRPLFDPRATVKKTT